MAENWACSECGMSSDGARYHPYAMCALVKQIGSHRAEANLAAVLRDARSDEPWIKERVDALLSTQQSEGSKT